MDPATGRRRLVVDAGANAGTITMTAASYGCRVIAFEPQKEYAGAIRRSIKENGFEDLVTLHEMAIHDTVR